MKHVLFILLGSLYILNGTRASGTYGGLPPKLTEEEKIMLLIRSIENLRGAQFDRNDSLYSPEKAARYLRTKWNRAGSSVKTASDFIDKVASISSTTGKPLYIVYANGNRIRVRDFLIERLREIEQSE